MEHPLNVYITAHTLISSLGFGTEENLEAIRNKQSGICMQKEGRITNTPILAAAIDSERLDQLVEKENLSMYTHLEQLFILTIQKILLQSGIDLKDSHCGLILSTTKGNIDLLNQITGQSNTLPDEKVFLWKMAERIRSYFQATNQVEVISNACISGVSALIVAKRRIESGQYKKIIVAGGDLLSPFITSGFLSFKSISTHRCRPYDAERDGLNLGEACGAILLSAKGTEQDLILSGGAISNDANHISGPSRTGDGLYFAIRQAMEEAGVIPEQISFINAHGTATVYNDEMESKAIHLAGLENTPVTSLKPYFGHTLGASGVIETIICLHQLKERTLFGTLGYKASGVPKPIIVHATHQEMPMQCCIKTASGFGGCNAALVITLPSTQKQKSGYQSKPVHTQTTATVSITQSRIELDRKKIFHSPETDFALFIREAFKHLGESNMKFYKMDNLCKLGYVAAGYLLKEKNFNPEEIAILLSNAASSLDTDIKHQTLIHKNGVEGASPAVFVYTLPNVVAGEICIHHKIQGENTFFISQEYDVKLLEEYARTVIEKGKLKACIIGWCDLLADQYKAELKLIEIQ